MVDSINTAIRLMCKAHKHGRLGMASDLGMTIDQFHNHLYQKCGSRFFTLAELERMEDLSGSCYLAEYQANRKGKWLVDVPTAESLDNVELYSIEMKAAAASGELANAKMAAAADGVIDSSERKTLSELFSKKLRHQIHGFLGFMALYGVVFQIRRLTYSFQQAEKVTPASVQLRAPWRVVSVEKLTHEQCKPIQTS